MAEAGRLNSNEQVLQLMAYNFIYFILYVCPIWTAII